MSEEERIEYCQNFTKLLDKYIAGEVSDDVFDKAFDDFMTDCDNRLIFN